MKITAFILVSILLVSCTRTPQDESNEIIPNLGNYTVQSMTSDLPIDANFDGVYDNDFLKEILSESMTNRSELLLVKNPNSNNFGILASISVMSRPDINQPTDYTVILNQVTTADVNFVDNTITKTTPIPNRDGTPSETRIIEFKIIDEETVKLKFNHNLIYDVSSKEWKTIKIDAVYKKNKLL